MQIDMNPIQINARGWNRECRLPRTQNKLAISASRSCSTDQIRTENRIGLYPIQTDHLSWSLQFVRERLEKTVILGQIRTNLELNRNGRHVVLTFF